MKESSGEVFSSRPSRRALYLAGVLTLASVCVAAPVAFGQTSQRPERREGTTPAAQHEHHAAHHEPQRAPPATVETASSAELIKLNRVEIQVPDVEVLEQEGRRVRFHTDLIKGKVVVVSFIYTSCPYTCPAQGKYLASLQRALGDRLGREVFLITVSTDPLNDTPARLKKWGVTFGAKEGWSFVTGEESTLENLRERFPGVRAGRDTHEALIFVGDDARGLWVRADGLRPTAEILSLIEAVAAFNVGR
jgi:protein SCO1